MSIHPLNKIKLAGTVIAIVTVGLIAGIDRPDIIHAQQNNIPNVHGFLWSDMPNGSDHCKVGAIPTNPPNPSVDCPQVGNSTNLFSGRGLGWISVNSTDPQAGGGSSYGVTLNMTSGDFSGQAWNEHGGWLDFDPAGTKPNALGNSAIPAKLDGPCLSNPVFTSCPVLGWVKFTSGGSAESGGWDGWVSMQGINPNYGVRYDKGTKTFSGHGWGDWVAGWIDFSNMSVDVVVSPPEPQWMRCQDATGRYYFYLDTSPRPAVCDSTPSVPVDPVDVDLDPLDFCSIIPGDQGRTGWPRQYDADGDGVREWYGLVGFQCIESVCPNYNGFYATPPDGEVILPNGTCGKVIDYCQANPQNCQPVNGVIRPIYRED